VNAKEAIGMLVAGKAGAKEPYTRQDLKYDLATQVIKLVSTNTADPDEPDELDRAAIAASTFISAGLRDEVNIGPSPLGHQVWNTLSAVVLWPDRALMQRLWAPTNSSIR
jgi:hypothetical protein